MMKRRKSKRARSLKKKKKSGEHQIDKYVKQQYQQYVTTGESFSKDPEYMEQVLQKIETDLRADQNYSQPPMQDPDQLFFHQ